MFERELQRRDTPRTDLDAVIRAYTHGDIELTKEQKALDERLLFVDAQLRQRRRTNDAIIRMTMKKYGISRYRAERDIAEAMKLFGESRQLNKAYLIHHHIEDIKRTIQKCQEKGMLELLPKFFDNLVYALNSLPAEAGFKDPPPAQIIYVLNGEPPVQTKDTDELLADADAFLKTPPPIDAEYIDFTEGGEQGHHPGAEQAPDDGQPGPGQ